MDFGKVASSHLGYFIRLALKARGWDIEVFSPEVDNPEYDDIYPENVPKTPAVSGKALIGQPIEGLTVSDFIRLTDVTKEVIVTTDLDLEVDCQVKAKALDGRELNLRITKEKSVHPLSELHWIYTAVMM